MNNIKLKTLFLLLIFCCPLVIFCQSNNDSTTVFYKKSLTFRIANTNLEGGFGGTFWFSPNHSAVIILNGHYNTVETSSGPGYRYTASDISIYPVLSFRQHIFTKENITPYVGLTFLPTWFVGEFRKTTILKYGVVAGVESWISENITIIGEQAFLNSVVINEPESITYNFGEATISISFYF